MAQALIMSPLKAARRGKILDAAQSLFAEQGLRMTTMESVAARSNVSKATVYSYFRDKDEIFSAVVVRIAEKVKARVGDALSQKGSVASLIAAALNAKHDFIFELVRRSPFASELFAAQNQTAIDQFAVLNRWIENQMVMVIEREAQKRDDAKAIAFLLFSASVGIANHAHTTEQSSTAITRLCRAMLDAPH